jgi:PAS domain S-box-containing protein
MYAIRQDGVSTDVSPSVTRLVGYAPEVVGKHIREIIYPDDVPACKGF